MSRIKITRKQIRSGIGILCLFVLIVSTFAYAVTGMSGSKSGSPSSILTGNGTELYLMVNPNNNTADYLLKAVGGGLYIEYLRPGAQLSIPLNSTIQITAYACNYERENMTHQVIAYQGIVDPDNTLNLTILFNSTATTPVRAGNTMEYQINVSPAYASEKSFIGVALIDASDSNSGMLNMTSVNASVY